MPVKFLKRVNANEQEVQGGQKIPRLQGAANIPAESDACHGYSSNWPKLLYVGKQNLLAFLVLKWKSDHIF